MMTSALSLLMMSGGVAAGALLGHGSIVVFDDTVDMAAMARYAMEFCALESCGKCTPCRIGSTRGTEVIDRIVEGAEILAMRNAEALAGATDGAPPETVDVAPFLRLSAHIRQSKARTFDAIAATWEGRLKMTDLARAVRQATKK